MRRPERQGPCRGDSEKHHLQTVPVEMASTQVRNEALEIEHLTGRREGGQRKRESEGERVRKVGGKEKVTAERGERELERREGKRSKETLVYALCLLADYLLLQPFVFAKGCQKSLGVSVRYLTFQTWDFLQDPSTGGRAAITQYYHLQLQNTNGSTQ